MPKRKKPRKLTQKQIARAGDRIIKQREFLRPIIREATKTGLVEAIENTQNFWQISDGYKRFIENEVKSQAAALNLAVRAAIRDALREVLAERPWKRRKPKS